MTERVDTGTKNGNKPGATNDDTFSQQQKTESSRVDDSESCHLSSVVEQRFRKPSPSEAAERTSEPKPVNAGFQSEGLQTNPPETPDGSPTSNAADHAAGVEQALRNAVELPPRASPTDYPWFEYQVLAAEVRRLRNEIVMRDDAFSVTEVREALAIKREKTAESEVRLQREAMRVMSINEGRLHAEIAELQTRIARVEALRAAFTDGPGNSDGEGPSLGAIEKFFDDLEAELKGTP